MNCPRPLPSMGRPRRLPRQPPAHPSLVSQYLYFMVYLSQKDQDEYTGQESYVSAKLQQHDISFFPLHKSLDAEGHAPASAAAAAAAGSPPVAAPEERRERPETPLLRSESASSLRESTSLTSASLNEFRETSTFFQRGETSFYPQEGLYQIDPLQSLSEKVVERVEYLDSKLETLEKSLGNLAQKLPATPSDPVAPPGMCICWWWSVDSNCDGLPAEGGGSPSDSLLGWGGVIMRVFQGKLWYRHSL